MLLQTIGYRYAVFINTYNYLASGEFPWQETEIIK